MITLRRPKPEPRRVLFATEVTGQTVAKLEEAAREKAERFYGRPAEIVGDYTAQLVRGYGSVYEATIRLRPVEPST